MLAIGTRYCRAMPDNDSPRLTLCFTFVDDFAVTAGLLAVDLPLDFAEVVAFDVALDFAEDVALALAPDCSPFCFAISVSAGGLR